MKILIVDFSEVVYPALAPSFRKYPSHSFKGLTTFWANLGPWLYGCHSSGDFAECLLRYLGRQVNKRWFLPGKAPALSVLLNSVENCFWEYIRYFFFLLMVIFYSTLLENNINSLVWCYCLKEVQLIKIYQ